MLVAPAQSTNLFLVGRLQFKISTLVNKLLMTSILANHKFISFYSKVNTVHGLGAFEVGGYIKSKFIRIGGGNSP